MRALALLGLLTAATAQTALAAPPRSTHLWYDARHFAQFARPTVRATVGGQPAVLAVDTGSGQNVWSELEARRRSLKLEKGRDLLDYEMRPHALYHAQAAVAVEGLGPILDELDVSDWIDALQAHLPEGAPHFDGVISPQLLARNGGAVLIDFLRGELRLTSWHDALAQLRGPDRVAALESRVVGDKFLVTAQVGGRELRLAVDTGAPTSLIYAPRGLDLPDDAVRRSVRTARVRVGEIVRDLEIERLEPLDTPGFDGLLGMDVLKECAIAIDQERLILSCRGDRRVARGSDSAQDFFARESTSKGRVCFGPDDLCLQPLVEGGWRYEGDRVRAWFRPDGGYELESSGREQPLSMRSSHEEIRWLLDQTALMRYQTAHQRALRHSFAFLPRHLASVWRDPRYSLARRHEILFLLWDECAEPDDPELAAAGRRARGMIERFVRRELPDGSEVGFNADELRRFNARRVRGPRFDPYHPDPAQDRYDDGN